MRDQGKRGPGFYVLAIFFALFVAFLYGPLSTIVILSFQGPDGGLTFPMNGVSFHWFRNLFEKQAVGDFGGSFLRSLILGGLGIGLIEGGGPGENVALALEADSIDDVRDPTGRTFRAFADQTRSDRRALAACLRGSRRLMTREEAASITVPTLIAVGTTDEIAGSAHRLAEVISGSQVLDIPNRDHMRAVGDKVYKEGVLAYLANRT